MPAKTDPGRQLNPAAYSSLCQSVSELLEAAASAESTARVTATWQVGQRLRKARISQKAGYHSAILRDLAVDTGQSVRALQEALAFHAAYPRPPKKAGLGWSHYRQLVRLPQEARDELEDAAAAQGWSARMLGDAIAEWHTQERNSAEEALERPSDPSYLYLAQVENVVDGDTLDVAIDLGFQVTRHQRLRLANIDAPEMKTGAGRTARNLLFKRLDSARTLVVATQRVDQHGRYVAHLFTSQAELTIRECFEHGRHLNAELLSSGHYVYKKK